MPENLRVEEQAFGRTARQGAKGTAQLIISKPNVAHKFEIKSYSYNSINEFKVLRNCKEYIKTQETKLYVVEKIKLQDLLFEEYLKIECNVRNAIQNQWQVSQLEDIWGIELTKLGNLVYKNHKAQKGLQDIASKFGFIVSKENVSSLNSLYRTVNTALGRTITDEHLQLLTIGYFLDRNYVQNSISRDEIKSNEFFDKLTQEFTDQAALKILSLIKTINIVLLRSDKEEPEIYRVKGAKGTIYIGLEASSEMHSDKYKFLFNGSDTTEDIEKYLNQALEEESIYAQENQNIFQRQDVMILLDSIMRFKAREAENCNKAKKEVALNFFGEFFEQVAKDNSKFMQNPNYLVRDAIISGYKDNEYSKSLKLLDEVCNVEPQYSLSACYNKAYLLIKNHTYHKNDSYIAEASSGLSLVQAQTAKLSTCLTPEAIVHQLALAIAELNKIQNLNQIKNYDGGNYKEEAISYLSLAQEQIDQVLIPNLECMYLLLLGEKQTELLQQIINKIEILKVIRGHIEQTKDKIFDCKGDIEIGKMTPIEEVFSKSENLKDRNIKTEVGELIDEGICWFFDVEDIQEKANRVFGTVFTFVAGLVQIGIGMVCSLYVGNINLGAQLIVEGAKDLYKSMQIASGEIKFSMEEYISEKATTLAVFMTIKGVQIVLSRMAATSATAAKMLKPFISTGEAIGTASTKLLLEKTCVEVGRITAKSLISTGVNYLIDKGAQKVIEDNFKDDFQKRVINGLKECLDDSTTSSQLRQLLVLDRINYNTFNYKRILECISSLIQDNRNILREMINAGIDTVLSQSQHHIVTAIGIAAKFADSAHAWFEIDKVINNLSKTLSNKIDALYRTRNTTLVYVLQMKLQQLLGLPGEAQSIAYSLEAAGTWSGNLNQASFNTYTVIDKLNKNNWKYKYDYYTTNYIMQALYQIEQAINADYSGVKSELIENCQEYITQKILYKVRAEVFGHVTHAASQKLSNYVFDSLSKIKQELNKQKEARIRKASVAQVVIKDIKNANDTVALLEKQHKDLINSIVASISVEEVLKEAVANYNSASQDGELIATLVKTQENLIAKILIADPSTNKNSAIANDNSATPSNDQQHLVTWKGNKIPVTKLELWMSWSLDKIGAGDIARRYFDILARINQIGKSDVRSFADIMKQTPLELLLNSNIGAIFLEVSGRCLIWTTAQLDQITAQYFPKTRAFIETAVSLTVDKAVSLTKAMLEQLPEPARSVFINSVLAVYEKSKTLYLNLTEDLYEGQKALVDFTLGCAVGEVAGRVVGGVGGVVKGAVGGAVEGAVAASNILKTGTKLKVENISPIKVLVDQKSAATNNHITGALIVKTEDKVTAIFNVEKGVFNVEKGVGKTIANANIPNELISLNNISQKNYELLKTKFGDKDLQLLIQKLEQKKIFGPNTPYFVANLPKDTPTLKISKYGNGKIGIWIGEVGCTQRHHIIPKQLKEANVLKRYKINIDCPNNIMTLYTPNGLKLATERANRVREHYAKILKQLNPTLTQKEADIIAWRKVPLPNQQRSTHSGRHDNSYVVPIERKLDDLWKDVELGKLNEEECKKAIYDLMDELRRCIKNGSIKLN
ncbi:AHH domain-containing protein [Orientia tsutsugamushi]|uniref:AHH domain-containing protein n=1 Tax=Orientia tsutsugamushi TaxID=784 RepID=UPI000D5A36F6|nr:Uncharacterised protein [Orientia tsutsugamushi]